MEFLDETGKVISKLTDRLIITENVRRRTVGKYPHIRIHADQPDCMVTVSESVVLITGKS